MGQPTQGNTGASRVDIKSRLQLLTPATLGGLETDELAAFECTLLGILRYEPDKRISAREVL